MIEQYDLFEKPKENKSQQQIIHGDCLQVMTDMKSDSIDFCVTDPPYALSFMGKNWDKSLPSIDIWKQLLRILKPGSMMACAGAPRIYHRLACLIEDAGFEIRDCLMWLYGQGFPKSHNNFGLPGFGTALKPAYEPWILCQKPLDGTYAQNVERWGIGGINIDESRIPTNEKLSREYYERNTINGWDRPWMHNPYKIEQYKERIKKKSEICDSMGRWPANVILDEEAASILDQQSGFSKSAPPREKPCIQTENIMSKSKGIFSPGSKIFQNSRHGDSGGASRFFKVVDQNDSLTNIIENTEEEKNRFLYCAKASTSERNKGLEGLPLKIGGGMNSTVCGDTRSNHITKQQNNHPTVKPIALMKYIIKLLAPPNNPTLIDPFLGSGTTLLACKDLQINAIGIEKEEEYVNIAKERIKSW